MAYVFTDSGSDYGAPEGGPAAPETVAPPLPNGTDSGAGQHGASPDAIHDRGSAPGVTPGGRPPVPAPMPVVLPRRRAPYFKAEAVEGLDFKTVSLDDYRGKWLVLFFYPFDFTFVCPTEIVAFSNAVSKLRGMGVELAAVSCDSKHVHLSWTMQPKEQGGLGQVQMPLIADYNKKISRDYGVLVEDEEDEMCGAALRALFIIDAKGIVRSVLINDEAVGRNVDETIRLIQAFQYADEHGETCPANWKPGDATIKPDREGARTFFKKWSLKRSGSNS